MPPQSEYSVQRHDICAPLTQHALAFGVFLAMLVTATWVCFSPALSGPFIFDDFPNLEHLRHLNAGVSPAAIGRYLAAVHGDPARPLAMLSFLIEDAAWPTDPYPYKRNNLLLHLIAGLLVCWIAVRLSTQLELSPRRSLLVVMFCCAAWTLAPMQLSATMLVVQRMTILSAIFVLAGLLAYICVIQNQRWAAFPRVVLGGGILAFFGAIAYLCKENGVLIFAFATVLNLTLLRSQLATMARVPRRLLLSGTAAPILALAGYFAIRWDWVQSVYLIRDFTMGERLLTQSRILIHYIFSFFIPRVGGQGILHDDFVISRSLTTPLTTLFATALISAAIFLAVNWRRRFPVVAFAVLWFFAGHLLESTIIALELYFEHRNYVAIIGPLIAVPYAAARLPSQYARWIGIALAAWLLACAILTRINAATWGDRGVSSLVWLEEHPTSRRAIQWAAAYYMDSGDLPTARATLQQGIDQLPNEADLKLQMTLFDCVTQGISPARWEENVVLMRRIPYSHLSTGVFRAYVEQALSSQCKGTLNREMLLGFAEAFFDNPAYQRVPASLSGVHYELAKMYVADRNLTALIHHLDEAYRLDPQPTIAREAAVHLLTAGLPEAALRYLDISDSTPLPWMKKWLADPVRQNSGLRKSAEAMLEKAHEQSERTHAG